MNIQRKNLNNIGLTIFNFNEKCGKWLVKNFSDGDIFVSFNNPMDTAKAVKIPSKTAQVVIDNEYLKMEVFKHDTIFAMGTGEVEVQQLCFH